MLFCGKLCNCFVLFCIVLWPLGLLGCCSKSSSSLKVIGTHLLLAGAVCCSGFDGAKVQI